MQKLHRYILRRRPIYYFSKFWAIIKRSNRPLQFVALICAISLTIFIVLFLYFQHFTIYEDLIHKYSQKKSVIGSSDLDSQILFRYDTDYNESINNIGDEFARTTQNLPSCLIIGVRKGGTRALLDAIALHSAVRAARREIHFFDKIENFRRGTKWYLEQMPFSFQNQVTIEKTPAYFVNHQTPARVAQFNPKIKVILIVRDPVIRMISDFTQVYYTRLERNKTQIRFEDAAFLKANGSFQLNRSYKPVRNSLYADHFQHWLRHFPARQILVIDGDEFIRSPLEQLRFAEKFLEIPRQIEADQLVFNKKKGFYCFRRKNRRVARCLGETKGRVQAFVPESTRHELARLLRADNELFFRQVGREFPRWY